jgi:hypothetical protein
MLRIYRKGYDEFARARMLAKAQVGAQVRCLIHEPGIVRDRMGTIARCVALPPRRMPQRWAVVIDVRGALYEKVVGALPLDVIALDPSMQEGWKQSAPT